MNRTNVKLLISALSSDKARKINPNHINLIKHTAYYIYDYMRKTVYSVILAVLAVLFTVSCSPDTVSSGGSEENGLPMPVFVNPVSSTSRAIDVSSPDTGESVSIIYLHHAPALMGFSESGKNDDGSATVMVYGKPVEVRVTQDGSDIIYNGTSSDLLFTIRLHADGSLDYRQSANLVYNNQIEYLNVTEGVDMKVDEDGNVRGSFRSWFAMEFQDGSGAGASAMYGEVRSKGDIYAMVNLSMKMLHSPLSSLPSLEEAFEYSLDEKLEESSDAALYHPYQIGWLKDSVFNSYEFNNSETEGDYSPTNREKCEKLNGKIVEIFGDNSWKVEYLGENPETV